MSQDPLTEQIIAAAIEVHRILGSGLLESVCEEALCYELELSNMRIERQKEVDVIYKGKVIKGQRLDLVVNEEVVVEIKSARKLEDIFFCATAFVSQKHRTETRAADKFWGKKTC